MQKIKVFLIKIFIKFFGINDILEHVSNDQFLEIADVDQLIEDIDDMHDGKMEEFLTEKYSD